mmetsp:Transcript_104/g.325  ORF Transcript_104/g.325 Transcript_104/m.325 type:complete len:292 (-) Transcript_104:172-1047(-)
MVQGSDGRVESEELGVCPSLNASDCTPTTPAVLAALPPSRIPVFQHQYPVNTRGELNAARVIAVPSRAEQRRVTMASGSPRHPVNRPITISWIIDAEDCSQRSGKLGLCYAPGKRCSRGGGGKVYERNLDEDLGTLAAAGITIVVNLLNEPELRLLKISNYDAAATRHGLTLLHFPIIEGSGPPSLADTRRFVEDLTERRRHGETIVMHCRGGVGRAGLMAACMLLQGGFCRSPTAAIRWVRKRRCPEAVETRRQEDFISSYNSALRAEADTQGAMIHGGPHGMGNITRDA